MKRTCFPLGAVMLTTVSLSVITALSPPAQAGFNWTPPAQISASPNARGPQSSSAEPTGPLTPMPGTIGAAPIEPVSESDLMDVPPAASSVQFKEGPSEVVKTQSGMRSINVLKKTETTQTTAVASTGPTDLTLPEPGVMANAGEVLTPMPGDMPNSMMTNTNSGMAIQTVDGFGKDIPLALALQQILPPGYDVRFQSGVDEGKPMTWKGNGRPWVDVLNDMLRARKLHATWENSAVVIANGTGADLSVPTVSSSGMMAAMPSLDRAKPTVDLAQKRSWTATKGASLREVLQNWSGDAQAELAWQAPTDYRLTSGFSFDGSFDQAVDALLSLYGEDAKQPRGTLYPNLPAGPSVLLISSN